MTACFSTMFSCSDCCAQSAAAGTSARIISSLGTALLAVSIVIARLLSLRVLRS